MPVVENTVSLSEDAAAFVEGKSDDCKDVSKVDDWPNDHQSSSSEDEVGTVADAEM